MLAAFSLIVCPFVTTTLAALIAIFPSSTETCNPNAPSSLIAGPGNMSVGPSLTSMSSIAT